MTPRLGAPILAWVVAFAALAVDAHADDDASAPPTSTPPTAPVPPPTKRVVVDLSGGAAYQGFFGIPIYGADFGLAIGPDNGNGADLFAVGGFYGRTGNGLTVGELRIGYTPEWRMTSWARLELGIQVVYLNVAAIAGVENQWGLGPGLRPTLTFDFAPLGDGHAFVALGGELDAVSSTFLASGFVHLGVRF